MTGDIVTGGPAGREGRGREHGGKARRERRSVGGGIRQLPFKTLRNPYKPIEILSEDQVETIHLASLEILENIGIESLHMETIDLFERAGAKVDRSNLRVCPDRGLILEAIKTVPPEFTL